MSAFATSALDAIALQLLAALQAYERDVAVLVDNWHDLELHRRLGERLDRIRMFSSALPEVRVQWVEVLIAHSELTHRLWQTAGGQALPLGGREELLENHRDAVAALRNRCMRLTAASITASQRAAS